MSDLPQKLDRDGLVIEYGDGNVSEYKRVEQLIEAVELSSGANRLSLMLFFGYIRDAPHSLPHADKAMASQEARSQRLKEARDRAEFQREQYKKKPKDRTAPPETAQDRKRRQAREKKRRQRARKNLRN